MPTSNLREELQIQLSVEISELSAESLLARMRYFSSIVCDLQETLELLGRVQRRNTLALAIKDGF